MARIEYEYDKNPYCDCGNKARRTIIYTGLFGMKRVKTLCVDCAIREKRIYELGL
jgi:hypothetical protein